MKKNIRIRRIDYEVLNILDEKNVHYSLKSNINVGLVAIQDYLKIYKKPRIYYSDEERENLAEYWGTKKRRPTIIIFIKSIASSEDSREIAIRSIIHEYLHYFFDRKKLNKLFDLQNEEELVERIEEDVWQKYFI